MRDHQQDALILFFIKYPEAGEVKTRLAEVIGSSEAAELYRNFILDMLLRIKSSGLSFKICFSPEKKGAPLIAWLGKEYGYAPQRGGDLGGKMKTAFKDNFAEGYERVVLIGSDFPDLPSSFLNEAVDTLNTHDSVIGPALDGGYYLIGFKRRSFVESIFKGMDWGREGVFQKTLSMLKDHQHRVHILPAWNDVDTLEDLKQLVRRSESTHFSGSKTMAFISRSKFGLDL